MKRQKAYLASALALLMLLCAGCAGEKPVPSTQPTPSASVQPSDAVSAPPAEESPSPAPGESAEPTPGLTLPGADGEQAAQLYESALGYTILYPAEGVTVKSWDTGENYTIDATPGTYLAVSILEAANVNEAAAGLRFENGIEDEPTGFLFGSAGYAGVRLEQKAGGLRLEYILLRENDRVYLVERAVFTGGEAYEPMLQAMLDSFTVTA